MCGISGIYQLNSEQLDIGVLQQFTDSMQHRGPDGSGYEMFENNTLGLGHRRLSILDLSDAGKQPFFYKNKYTIVYNGEVFNFLEIKKGLIEKGYEFHSNTDTEVVIAAYDCYGEDCFHLFNGMWAMAIWDNIEKKLLLCRDRFGIKPLYYLHLKNKLFAFASETRAFKYLKGFVRTLNQERIAISKENIYALEGLGYTIFNDIYQLLPGHYIEFKLSDIELKQTRWYDITEQVKHNTLCFEEQKNEFYKLFKDACRIRLISDVPVATALSGGLDSSSIYSTVYDLIKNEKLDRVNSNSQLAVSAVFPGLPNDEKEYVEKALNYTKGNIKWIETDVENLEQDIEKETELFDSISNAPITSISSIYKGMKQAGITVSIDGHGVDEMLYGYLYMLYDLWSNSILNQNKTKSQEYSQILAGLYHPIHQEKQLQWLAKSNNSITWKSKLIYQIKKLLKAQKNEKSYTPIVLKSLSDKPYQFNHLPIEKRMLYHEFFVNTLPSLLRNFDRASMMNSIEIRMPFMDYRLVEFVFSLPLSSKLNKGLTKYILRECMKGKMDEEIRLRKYKVGINSPFEHWSKMHLKNWLYNKIKNESNADELKSKLDDYYENGNTNNLTDVWYQINLTIING